MLVNLEFIRDIAIFPPSPFRVSDVVVGIDYFFQSPNLNSRNRKEIYVRRQFQGTRGANPHTPTSFADRRSGVKETTREFPRLKVGQIGGKVNDGQR
jgi:hypothetical protein